MYGETEEQFVLSTQRPCNGGSSRTNKSCNPFIISTTSGKPNAAARRLIRSHVMVGKNRTKSLGIAIKLDPWSDEHVAKQPNHVQIPDPHLDISGAGLSVMTFADEMQPYMLDLVFQCQYL
jgi:hypothetical protein